LNSAVDFEPGEEWPHLSSGTARLLATGGSAGQCQDIGLQVVDVGPGKRGQTGSEDFWPAVKSTSGASAIEK